MGKCIGTSTAPYVDINSFPRVEDANKDSKLDGDELSYNNHLGAPGYGMGPDGRKRQRRLALTEARIGQLNSMANVDIAEGVVGRRTSNGEWPLYNEILDTIPVCS
jgi:hypothetical protein